MLSVFDDDALSWLSEQPGDFVGVVQWRDKQVFDEFVIELAEQVDSSPIGCFDALCGGDEVTGCEVSEV